MEPNSTYSESIWRFTIKLKILNKVFRCLIKHKGCIIAANLSTLLSGEPYLDGQLDVSALRRK
jgi:hypothetical protein